MDTRFNGEDPMSVNTRLEGHNSGPKNNNDDIALDIGDFRKKLEELREISKRIGQRAPQVGKTLREQLNMLERFTARFK